MGWYMFIYYFIKLLSHGIRSLQLHFPNFVIIYVVDVNLIYQVFKIVNI